MLCYARPLPKQRTPPLKGTPRKWWVKYIIRAFHLLLAKHDLSHIDIFPHFKQLKKCSNILPNARVLQHCSTTHDDAEELGLFLVASICG